MKSWPCIFFSPLIFIVIQYIHVIYNLTNPTELSAIQ